ncbi:hypothetical protein SBRCBS47491_009064 [Sporothrix bragantina]|uniref:Uncharacterized protein n=1 Tax=Sporothrix bragantina TaxID=671064 RepID=A0ABP0CRS0_9PEZI
MATRNPFTFRTSSSSLIPLTMNPKTKNFAATAESTRTSTTTAPGAEGSFVPSASANENDTRPLPSSAYIDPCCYPPHVPGSTDGNAVHAVPFYVAARIVNILLGLVLFALALVVEFRYKRGTWVNPIMTPSISALAYSGYDVFLVLFRHRRGHPHMRILYDGVLLGTGLAVASGFLTAWAVQTAPEMGYRISVPILVGMYGMMVIQYGLGLNGVYQVVQMRREARQAGV